MKVVALRECPMPEAMHLCDTPQRAVDYWHSHVETAPYFNPDCECLISLLLTTRRRIKGHHLVSIGTLDTIITDARSIFRVAIVGNASAVVLMHNHPSGQADPSPADVRITRDLMRAGQLLKIELIDHLIIGNGQFTSLRELGYLF